MAGPQPVAVDDEDGDDEQSEAEEAVDQRLDELEDAKEAQRETVEEDDPFDDDEELDLDLAETNVGEELNDGEDDPFDGTDGGGSDRDDPFDGTESGHQFDGASGGEFGDEMSGDGFDVTDGTLPSTLNEGAAKLAVLGLPEEFEHHGETKTKQDLQDEFEEVFETFKLGDFGAQVAEEYLFVEDDGVDPLVAFTCSLALCTVIVAMSRPDTDEIVSKAKSRFSGMAGGDIHGAI